jgi:hypothetical protein
MKSLLLAVAVAGALPLAGPSAARAETRLEPVVITVSCFRGPWRQVIIDQPNQVFIDSLMAAGYSSGEAFGIGVRVCRDQLSVSNPARLVSETYRILGEEQPR